MNLRMMPATLMSLLARQPGSSHVVDQLIAERATRLTAHAAWPLLRPAFYRALHYRQAVSMADAMAEMSGWDAMTYLSDLLKLQVNVRGSENLPAFGPFILAPSHPTGIADGIAIFDMLSRTRPDMAIFANRDALRVAPRFRDLIIPVEWRQGHKSRAKSRDTLEMTANAFRDGKVVVLFPSGRIAYWNEGRLTERPWQNSLVALARRYEAPIVPVNLTARNSGLFYLLSRMSNELRDMTVFHELLNKKRAAFSATIGRPIDPSALEGEADQLTRLLQAHTVETLANDPAAVFLPKGSSLQAGSLERAP